MILLTGATGYVGGRLLRALEASGRRVRCLARRPEFLTARVSATTEVVQGDVLDLESLRDALRDVHTAYYRRPIYGTVRYQSLKAAEKKFDVARYLKRYPPLSP